MHKCHGEHEQSDGRWREQNTHMTWYLQKKKSKVLPTVMAAKWLYFKKKHAVSLQIIYRNMLLTTQQNCLADFGLARFC